MRTVLTGLRAWMVQRVSAVYMLLFLVFLLFHFVLTPPHSYQAWRDWVRSPFVGIAASVFFAALLAHVWVGIRDVVLDYVRPIGARVLALALLGLCLAGAGAWLVRILWLPRP
ncbi:MAG: succinate dehydrogenase, hydrophobic membrane anchor protein [Proteobacteria bacterium]|nr:succinate dehydrogenase, hydrophobic membrane anchor protein [Pseudomonadota bacterium]